MRICYASLRVIGMQVRGFSLAPYLSSEVDNKGRVLSEVMQFLIDGTISVHSGAYAAQQPQR